VHVGLSVEEPVQGFSTLAGSVGIHSFVDLGHCIEQAPCCPRQKLTVTGFTPFVENVRNLGRGDRSSIQGSYHNVVRLLIVDRRFIVTPDSVVKAPEFISKLTHSPCRKVTQISFSKAGVLS